MPNQDQSFKGDVADSHIRWCGSPIYPPFLIDVITAHNAELLAVLESVQAADDIADSEVKRLYNLVTALDQAIAKVKESTK